MRFLVAIADGLNTLRDFPPLFFRVLLAYIFFTHGMIHLQNVEGFGEFLAKLDVPMPELMAWVVTCFELASVVLVVGFATRIESLFLICIMVVAIVTVHWQHGFSSENNGYEKPLYYLLMLISLLITGPGKISLDGLFVGNIRKNKKKPQPKIPS
jgi:putative oxidoreductase